jgi:hypothetical protein
MKFLVLIAVIAALVAGAALFGESHTEGGSTPHAVGASALATVLRCAGLRPPHEFHQAMQEMSHA